MTQNITEIKPPPGGQIHTLIVSYELDRDWDEAINAGGPNTPNLFQVRKLDDFYKPEGMGAVEKEVILVNFTPSRANWDENILPWGVDNSLFKTRPRLVFALGEKYPDLHRTLGVPNLHVAATQECFFNGRQWGCGVRWDVTDRSAYSFWPTSYRMFSDWFAFFK